MTEHNLFYYGLGCARELGAKRLLARRAREAAPRPGTTSTASRPASSRPWTNAAFTSCRSR
jgi:hypothetical protein